jgi:hypothetical protein
VAEASSYARLKHVTGSRARVALMIGRGGSAELPDPHALRILKDGAGYSMLRLDARGASLAHTWHATLEAAKAEAAAVYGVEDADWGPTLG